MAQRNNNSNDNNDSDSASRMLGGFPKKAAKTVLPKSWTQSKEERKQELARKELRDEMKSGLQTLFKDMPLPARMLGSIVSPLITGAMSSIATTMKEQQQQMDTLLEDARGYILADPQAAGLLGEPIEIQPPFSQSSSTSSINGQTTVQIQTAFPVQGQLQQGIVTMTASENGIQQLLLQVNGRNLDIQLTRKSSGGGRGGRGSVGSGGIGKNRVGPDDIIDAEFVEKK